MHEIQISAAQNIHFVKPWTSEKGIKSWIRVTKHAIFRNIGHIFNRIRPLCSGARINFRPGGCGGGALWSQYLFLRRAESIVLLCFPNRDASADMQHYIHARLTLDLTWLSPSFKFWLFYFLGLTFLDRHARISTRLDKYNTIDYVTSFLSSKFFFAKNVFAQNGFFDLPWPL